MQSSAHSVSGTGRAKGVDRYLIEREKENRGGVMVAFAAAGCLWWFTWMQIEVAWFFGTPDFTWRIGMAWSLAYYLPAEPLGFPLPNLFQGLSIGLAVLGVGSTYLMNRRRPAILRLIALVAVFAFIAVGFSSLVISWRSVHMQKLAAHVEWCKGELEADSEFDEDLNWELERSREALGKYEALGWGE